MVIKVPMSHSIRGKPTKKQKATYYNKVSAICRGKRLTVGQRYKIHMDFYAKWTTKKGKIRRRDHLNYACTLIDILCDCLGIDDSQVWRWSSDKKDHKDNEFVLVRIEPTM